MAKYDADTIPTCVTCDSRNHTKSCKKCGVSFCKHFSSTTDLNFCGNCVADVEIKVSILEKTVEHIKADGTSSFSRKFQAKMIKLEGVDWLFASHLIEEMSDSEIEASVEYHRANVDLMLMEREARKQERIKKLAGIRLAPVTRKSQHQVDTEQKKSNKKAKVKQLSGTDILALLQTLAASGLSQEQITDMLGKGVK